jgi:hypothetical protein
MPTTPATRKPVEDLTASDLEAFAVWEFAEDEEECQDETWVRPLCVRSIPQGMFSLSVAAAARLACGLVYPAVLFCDTDNNLEVQAISLLTTGKRILIGTRDPAGEVQAALNQLGLSAAQALPIEYATRVPSSKTGALVFGTFAVQSAL